VDNTSSNCKKGTKDQTCKKKKDNVLKVKHK